MKFIDLITGDYLGRIWKITRSMMSENIRVQEELKWLMKEPSGDLVRGIPESSNDLMKQIKGGATSKLTPSFREFQPLPSSQAMLSRSSQINDWLFSFTSKGDAAFVQKNHNILANANAANSFHRIKVVSDRIRGSSKCAAKDANTPTILQAGAILASTMGNQVEAAFPIL